MEWGQLDRRAASSDWEMMRRAVSSRWRVRGTGVAPCLSSLAWTRGARGAADLISRPWLNRMRAADRSPRIRRKCGVRCLPLLLLLASCAQQSAGDTESGSGDLPAALGAAAFGDAVIRDVARIRSATADFRSLDGAVRAGYARDVQHCVDNPPAGAMGYHHQNDRLLDDRIEIERPEMLVYERLPDGEYRLNGVEYIVPFAIWPATREPPVVMGQKLKPAPALGIWYRHVWVWRENPSGLFADWNPLVTC